MKKVYAALLSTTMVLGFGGIASTAMADSTPVVSSGAAITIDGSVRMRAYAQKDTQDQTDLQNNTANGYDKRALDGQVRIGVTAKASDQITGRILLENDNGNNFYKNWYEWGDSTAAGLHSGGEKGPAMRILEAWILYTPGNWGIKVGHQPLSLGNKLFFDHTASGDDAIVAFINPTPSTTILGLIDKFEEGNAFGGGVASQADDIDGYVLMATQKVSDALNLGVNWTYLHKSGADFVQAVLPGLSFHNIGVTGDGTIGGNISYKLDYEYQTGVVFDTGVSKLDANGWAALGELSAKLNAFTVGGLIGYGSGDDPNTPDTDADAFLNFLSDVRYQTTMVGYRLPLPDSGGLGPMSGNFNTGLSNLALYQINAAMDTTCPLTGKDLALKGRVNYMQLNEVATGYSDKVGTEVELFADWQLGNGLTFGLEGAYLWADDAFESSPGLGDQDNAYFARTTLNLAF